jgi:NADH dehydrogenase FAD-containing subunit
VVVVGGSFAGFEVIANIRDRFDDITLIDKNEYFEYMCLNLRAFVKQDYIKELTMKYEDIA